MKRTALLLAVAGCLSPALATANRLNCDDFKAKMEERFQAKGVKHYSLEAVDMKADEGGAKVIGTCDGNTRKMLYKRGAAPAAKSEAKPEAKAEAKPAPQAAPKAEAKTDAKPADKPAAPAKPAGK